MGKERREKSEQCEKECDEKITNVIYIEKDDSESCKKECKRPKDKKCKPDMPSEKREVKHESKKCDSESSSESSSESEKKCKKDKHHSKHHERSDSESDEKCKKEHHRKRHERSDSESESDHKKPHRHHKHHEYSDYSDSDSECVHKKPHRPHKRHDDSSECDDKKKPDTGLNSDCFISMYCDKPQEIGVGEAIQFHFYHNNVNVEFDPSIDLSKAKVLRSGYFSIRLQMDTNIPCQFTLFINDVPQAADVFGTNTGATQFVASDVVRLNAGDVIQWVNYTTAQGMVTRTLNSGGLTPSINAQLTLIKIAELCENSCHDRTVVMKPLVK
jgi:hypothetical protein